MKAKNSDPETMEDKRAETHQIGSKIIRSVSAVMSGYLSFYLAVLMLWLAFGYSPRHNLPGTNFLVISIICEAFFAVGAGCLIALIVKRRELMHTGILATVFAISGIFYLFLCLDHYPFWVPLSTIFINAPGVMLGGALKKKGFKAKRSSPIKDIGSTLK